MNHGYFSRVTKMLSKVEFNLLCHYHNFAIEVSKVQITSSYCSPNVSTKDESQSVFTKVKATLQQLRLSATHLHIFYTEKSIVGRLKEI